MPQSSSPVEKELKQRFEDCVDGCADSMFRVAFRLTGDNAQASELVQETYLGAWKNIRSLSDPSKIRSWMFGILRNQYRKQIDGEVRSRKALQTFGKMMTDRIDDSRQTTVVVDRIQSAIEQLEDNQKLPLLLVTMEGFSVDEAADILNVPRGTVLSRMHRGREKLKAILERQDWPNSQGDETCNGKGNRKP